MLLGRAVGAGLDRVNLLVQVDALLRQHPPVAGKVDRATVSQRLLNLVAELSVELRDGLALTPVLPQRALIHVARTALGHAQPVVAHQLVVLLGHVPVHVVALERAAGDVVVVDDRDVVVRVTARTIDVRDHQHVTVGMQLLRELVAQVVDRLHGLRVVRVKLAALEALDDRPRLDLAPVNLRQCLSALDELLGALGIHAQCSHPVGALGLVAPVLLGALRPVQLVLDLGPGLGDALGVGDAHAARLVPPSSSSTRRSASVS